MKFLELLLGNPKCIICGSSTPENDYPLCQECCLSLQKNLLKQWLNCCYLCGLELISEKNICMKCRRRSLGFSTHYSLFKYSGIPKYLLKQYKFRNQKGLEMYFSSILNDYLQQSHTAFPIIPVPSFKGKIFRKTSHSSLEKICRRLKTRYSWEIYPVLKMKKGQKQKTLNAEERITNVKGRVSVKSRIKELRNKPVLLIDDVFTTGSTLSECSRVLLEYGIREVHAVTLYRD